MMFPAQVWRVAPLAPAGGGLASLEGVPAAVCLRVTRACNARCGFCLAPPDGQRVSRADIQRRIEWLAAAGVGKIHLCGGEPTIRPDLPDIVGDVRARGLACAVTTNGIRLSADLVERISETRAGVKVSLHGPPPFHDEMMGVACFDAVAATIDRLRGAGVATAIQTIVTRRKPDVHEWAIEYCLAHEIRKLRLVPFVPRGRGRQSAGAFQLDAQAYERLRQAIDAARRRLAPVLDVDVLDFWRQEYYVVETDGRLQIQRETDAADSILAHAG